MKKQHNTIVPRNKPLNDALIALGHKTHTDKRKKKLSIDKQKKQWKELSSQSGTHLCSGRPVFILE